MKHLFASLALLLLPVAAWPQVGTSTVRGSVRDQAQAVIPGAKVTLTNVATGVARESQSNEAGLYVFPGTIPGKYRITVAFAGLQTFEGNLTVVTAQDATVDATLQVAQAATSISVQDVTPVLQADKPSLGHVLERQRIEELPGLGRGYQNLLQTVPGVIWSSHGHGIGGQMTAFGLQRGSNLLSVDGAPDNEAYGGWDMPRTPDLDTIQEIHVEINNSSARYSRPTSVIMSTRSGTNLFHGSLFETNRNRDIGLARTRQDPARVPYLNRNEWGATVGGPVYIPKVYDGRNKLFYFFSYEGTNYQTYSTGLAAVPTDAMRNGDFSGLVDSVGRPITLYDPYTTDPVTHQRQVLSCGGKLNVICSSRFSPMSKFLMSYVNAPNLPQVNPLLGSNLVMPALRPLWQATYNTRIDYNISARDQVFVRYSNNRHREYFGGDITWKPIGDTPVVNDSSRWWPDQTAAVSWMHTVSPTMTNEVLVTGLRNWHQRGAGLDPQRFGGTLPNLGSKPSERAPNYAAMLGIPNPFNAVMWPYITNYGVGSMSGSNGDLPYFLVSNLLTLEDNATKMVGKHELQFGVQFRYEQYAKNADSGVASADLNTLATAQYDTASTPTNPQALPQTGLGLANLFLGVSNYTATFGRSWMFLRRNELAPYFQDNWKVTQRLTLNLGFRWDLRTPVFTKDNTMLGFDLKNKAYVLSTDLSRFVSLGNALPSVVTALQNLGGKIETTSAAGVPQHIVNFQWHNLGPRLGFAYRALSDRKAFVVRGGYRISSYAELIANSINSQFTPALVGGTFQYNLTNAALSPNGLPNYGLISVPQYVAGQNTGNSLIDTNKTALLTPGSFAGIAIDPKLHDPRVQDWNFTMEKEVLPNMVARATYLGNHTTNILQTVNYNSQIPSYVWYATTHQPLPTGALSNVAIRPYDQQVYGNVDQYASTGYEWYNGLQLDLERRFSRGIGFQVFYNIANVLTQTGTIQQTAAFLPGAMPADLDARAKLQNYKRDSTVSSGTSFVGAPKQQLRWNFILELPFGKGKKFAGNAHGVLQHVVGGWQVAGTGQLITTYWNLPTTGGYPTGTPIQVYGYKYPVQDCTSGACYPGYLWWNGYIPANRINSQDASGRPNGIMGVPADYRPAMAPLIPYGATATPPNAPAGTSLAGYYDTNTVWIPLNNGTVQRTTFDDNFHPWRNQAMPGPLQVFQDASAFKFWNLTEKVRFRFNVDFFNVFNHPNNPISFGNTGVLSTRTSGTSARTMQLSARLTW